MSYVMRLEPTIREGAAADAECLAALAIQVWLHTYATEGMRSAIAHYVLSEFTAQKFTHVLADKASQLLVAELNQHLIGYGLVKFGVVCPTRGNWSVELATLYVQEHFARAGVGSALLARCRNRVRERTGSADVWLTVNARNASAIAFYRKHGFLQAGIAPFQFGGEVHENYVFLAADA